MAASPACRHSQRNRRTVIRKWQNYVRCGGDNENFAPQLAKLAADLKIASRVRIVPRTVAGSDKERLFAAAQLFVLPSYSENFGNTVLEAMRRGVPVVVTPEVGAAEIVRTSGAGRGRHRTD